MKTLNQQSSCKLPASNVDILLFSADKQAEICQGVFCCHLLIKDKSSAFYVAEMRLISYLEKLNYCSAENWKMFFMKLSRSEIVTNSWALFEHIVPFKSQDKVNVIDC